jgi:hypothetical protein
MAIGPRVIGFINEGVQICRILEHIDVDTQVGAPSPNSARKSLTYDVPM